MTQITGGGAIEKLINARESAMHGGTVRQLLPAAECDKVGPFISFAHVRPAAGTQEQGVWLNVNAEIEAAALNYSCRHGGPRAVAIDPVGVVAHRIQCWFAVPVETGHEPRAFAQVDMDNLPTISIADSTVRVILGAVLGQESAMLRDGPAIFLDCSIPAGAVFKPPGITRNYAVYVMSGQVTIDGRSYAAGTMAIVAPGWRAVIAAQYRSDVIVFGGAAPRLSRRTPRWVWDYTRSSL